MRIQLKQDDIVSALRKYIGSQGIALEGKQVSVTFRAGRKGGGLSADVIIDDNANVMPDFDLGGKEAVVDVKTAAFINAVRTGEAGAELAQDPVFSHKDAQGSNVKPAVNLPQAGTEVNTPVGDKAVVEKTEDEGENRPLGQLPVEEKKGPSLFK